MYKFTVFTLILLIHVHTSKGQSKTADFEITLPTGKTSHSLYRTIRMMDSRLDTTYMGIVQLGMFNTRARVVPKTAFARQLQNVLNSLNDSTAGDGELLLQLRQFSFAEITKATSERGYCYLRVVLYAKAGDSYRRLDGIDTVLVTKSMDVTKLSARKASNAFSDLIARNLTLAPAEGQDVYTDYSLTRLDSIEKRKITVYNKQQYTEGVYRSYDAFMNQAPTDTIQKVEYDNGVLSTIRIPGKKAKGEKLKSSEVYALVYQGTPYISTEFGYYPLEKKEDDFYFVGLSRMAPTTGDMVTAQIFFGILGGLLVTGDAVRFQMKIDHISGGIVRIKQVY